MSQILKKLKALEIKKLLKELDYTESDFEYKKEVLSSADQEFMRSITDFLEKNPDIKEKYDKKYDEAIKNNIDNFIRKNDEGEEIIDEVVEEPEIEEVETEEEEALKPEPPKKIKKLFREIVKLTHPDKIKNKKLNDLYLEATKYYNDNDKLGIYKVCNDLNIEYDLDDEDNSIIENKITNLKNRIEFMEKTYTWMWYNCKDENEKNKIMISFIAIKIA